MALLRGRSTLLASACVLLAAGGSNARAAVFADAFADRQILSADHGLLTGNNNLATLETNEPRHAHKRGGHSMWISWVAPANGLLSINTSGSSFDTTMGVYTLESGSGSPMTRLREAGDDDDDDGSLSSGLQISVRAGARYEIAVDGFAGAAGDFLCQWDFSATPQQLPSVVRRPSDRAIRLGETLILTIDIDDIEGDSFQWMHGDVPVVQASQPRLVIPNFQPADVGVYRLRLTQGASVFYSASIEVQLNSDGISTTLARNKLVDATDTGGEGGEGEHRGPELAAVSSGLSHGYNGSQIFNTTYATRDPSEPAHCGVTGGASYWFAYQAPAAGVLNVDTLGSEFPTVLEVYTYTPPLTGYGDLISLRCDIGSGPGAFNSALQLAVEAGRSYLVVLDGVNGARGVAHLNYSLAAASPLTPYLPVILQQPVAQTVAQTMDVLLSVRADAYPPAGYQWLRDGQALPGQTAPSLPLTNAQVLDSGSYQVAVSNEVGVAFSQAARVDVIVAPAVSLDTAANVIVTAFPVIPGFQYVAESTPLAAAPSWVFNQLTLTDGGSVVWLTNAVDSVTSRFFRVRKP